MDLVHAQMHCRTDRAITEIDFQHALSYEKRKDEDC